MEQSSGREDSALLVGRTPFKWCLEALTLARAPVMKVCWTFLALDKNA